MAVLMLLPMGVSAKKKTADVKVISYNIRLGVAKDGTNSWEFRYPASAMMIDDQKPDIFGVQEAYDFQVKYLEEACTDYKSVGVGREDGADGEHEAADGGEAVADEFPPMAHDDGNGRKSADDGRNAQNGFVRQADEMRPNPVNSGG